tara:strand:+ start:228 stop:398 length:171 start_codon:yes stop_codon:yes gene_type:complete
MHYADTGVVWRCEIVHNVCSKMTFCSLFDHPDCLDIDLLWRDSAQVPVNLENPVNL